MVKPNSVKTASPFQVANERRARQKAVEGFQADPSRDDDAGISMAQAPFEVGGVGFGPLGAIFGAGESEAGRLITAGSSRPGMFDAVGTTFVVVSPRAGRGDRTDEQKPGESPKDSADRLPRGGFREWKRHDSLVSDRNAERPSAIAFGFLSRDDCIDRLNWSA